MSRTLRNAFANASATATAAAETATATTGRRRVPHTAAPVETPGVWRMLDGLVAANSDDHARIEQAFVFFDTLLASYTPQISTGK